MKKVSAIIRYKDEENWVGHSIQSFLDFFPDGQIIVVDNNSTDESRNIIKLFDYADITYTEIKDYTPGKSLNHAVELCKYETVLILSAHCVLTHVDQESLFNSLNKFSCVFGKQTPIFRGKKITRRYIWSHFTDDVVANMFSNQENRYFLHNAMCVYTKSILRDYPFDERLCGKEDRYWAAKIIEDGLSYLYDPSCIRCNHHYTENGSTWKGVG